MNQVKTRWRVYASLLALIAFLLFFVVTKHWGTLLYHEIRSSDWTMVKAQVTQFEMLSMMSDNRDRHRYKVYKPKLTYEYQWQGKTFFGSKLVWVDYYESNETDSNDTLYDRGLRLKQAKDRGDNIDIYINPRAPTESIIYRETAWHVYVVGFFSSILAGLPFFGLIYFTFCRKWFFLR